MSRPYLFYLASRLDDLSDLGPSGDWRVERKWDRIRGQFILRGGTHHLWSRSEDLMTDRFPEFSRLADFLPDGSVIDGKVLANADETPMPFIELQRRGGR